jgi:hypothetical protein
MHIYIYSILSFFLSLSLSPSKALLKRTAEEIVGRYDERVGAVTEKQPLSLSRYIYIYIAHMTKLSYEKRKEIVILIYIYTYICMSLYINVYVDIVV